MPPDSPEYLNPVSFGGYFKPVKKLPDMNDVVIPWKRIYATFPKDAGPPPASRRWTRKKIQKMLRFCRGPLERAVMLVAASSGIRARGFEGLERRDLVPAYRTPDGTLEMEDEGGMGGTAPSCRPGRCGCCMRQASASLCDHGGPGPRQELVPASKDSRSVS